MRAPRGALHWASRRLEQRGIESSARDSRILLRHALGCTEEALAGGRVAALSPEQAAAFQGLVARRERGEPVAYIAGKKEFMGLEFAVDRRVLIPRPETELLVEQALALFERKRSFAPSRPSLRHKPEPGESERANFREFAFADVEVPLIADVGTGSGAIAVSIARHLPQSRVYATDVSADALAVARRNGVTHGVAERLVFEQGDYLQALPEPVHVIVCNPPYIPDDAIAGLERDVRDFEPRLALAGGKDGLAAYRTLLADLPKRLLPGGAALFEIGFNQAAPLADLAVRRLPGARVEVFHDLAGFDRVMRISRNAPPA